MQTQNSRGIGGEQRESRHSEGFARGAMSSKPPTSQVMAKESHRAATTLAATATMQAIPVPERDKVQTYWDQTDATVDGMLGGFAGRTDRIETVSSRMFLLQLKPSLSTIVPPHRTDLPPRRLTKALDAGAGIGRVAGSTLLPLLDRVDCVETSAHFLDKRWRVQRAGRASRKLPRASASGTAGCKTLTPCRRP
jgi:hypothetical protein